MSYCVAVWDGEVPANDEQALLVYDALWERHGDAEEPPSQRILDYIVPDVVHVLANGRIAKSGGRDLALELEKRGYAWVEEEAAAAGR